MLREPTHSIGTGYLDNPDNDGVDYGFQDAPETAVVKPSYQ